MSHLRSLVCLLALLALSSLAGCPSAGDDDDVVGDDDDDSTPYVQPGPFEDMDFDERVEFMTEIVEPRMQELMQEFDADEFSSFSCSNCHGEDAEENEYELPNGLEALSNDDFPIEDIEDDERRAYAEFMEEEIVPEIAELLERSIGVTGVRCTTCHEFE